MCNCNKELRPVQFYHNIKNVWIKGYFHHWGVVTNLDCTETVGIIELESGRIEVVYNIQDIQFLDRKEGN